MKKVIAILLSAVMLFACATQVSAYGVGDMNTLLSDWLKENVSVPATDNTMNSIVDWTVFALSRSGDDSLSDAYASYVVRTVTANADSLYLSDSARYVLTAGAAGLNVRDIGGVDLVDKIVSANLTQEAYTASIAFALVALDSNGFGTDADRQELIDILLDAQRTDGGFNTYLVANESQYWTISGEIDATGMALQALAPYKTEADCADAIDDALGFIKDNKLATAGYAAYGSESAESTSQVLIALCCLGIDPLSADYTSGSNNILDAVSAFVNADGGGRCWDGSSNTMTSYQIVQALAAYNRYKSGDAGLYDLNCADLYCEQIMNSGFGEALPWLVSLVCSVVVFFCGLFNIQYFYFR